MRPYRQNVFLMFTIIYGLMQPFYISEHIKMDYTATSVYTKKEKVSMAERDMLFNFKRKTRVLRKSVR